LVLVTELYKSISSTNRRRFVPTAFLPYGVLINGILSGEALLDTGVSHSDYITH